MDKTGRIVVPPQFDWAESMHEGLAVIGKDGKYGYMDKSGKIVIPPKYISADGFSGGVAIVKIETEDGEKQGVIDKTGKWLFDLDYKILRSDYSKPFENGTAIIYTSEKYYNKDWDFDFNEKYGFINKSGKIIVAPKFDEVTDFHGDRAAVRKGSKWGFINKEGEYVKKPAYDKFKFLNNGHIWVINDEKGRLIKKEKWGLMDPSGKILKRPQFDWVSPLGPEQDKFLVLKDSKIGIKDSKFGILDINGKYIFKPEYEIWHNLRSSYFFMLQDYWNEKTEPCEDCFSFLQLSKGNKDYIINGRGETVTVVDWEKQEAQS